ncbi:MAG TPA: hypothetical protein VJU61_01360, partial [Polyangiaceae bacterium]|nr:hypothetical protein [Polyangiaceae bacterium]
MTCLRRRNSRALWVLVLSLLGGLFWLRPVGAQPMLQQVATDVGVLVAVPEGLRAAPGLSAWPDTAPLLVGLASFTDGAEDPLSVQIRRGDPHGWESLPAASPGMAAEWTQRFAAELEVPGAYDFTPGRYDPERGALSLQYKVAGPSSARRMQRLPDTHPFWAPSLEAGEEPRIAKCLLDALLGGQPAASEAELRARVPAAAEACSVPEAMVADYLQQLGSAEFAPVVTSITQLSFFTRSGTIAVLVMAPPARQQSVDAAAAVIWSETEVAEAERLPVESSTDLYRLAQLGGIVVGAVFGALLLGAGLSWVLVRLGVRAVLAVGGSLGLSCALSLLGWLRGGLALEGGLQLGGYLLTSALVFQPLVRWLSSRGSPLGPGSLLGRSRGLRRSRGLSTVEFVVILVLLACVAIGAWRIFGKSVKQAVFNSSEQIGELSSIQADDLGPGVSGSEDPSAQLGQASDTRSGDTRSGETRGADTRRGSAAPARRSGAGAAGPTAARDSGSSRP